ncbi:MAG: CHRD domain-containing protein [Burkholderiaceae bacterium]
MTLKKQLISIASSGLLGLAVWAPAAHAGHLNPVLETHLVGVEEVGSDAAKKGMMVGDPNARGHATVFGIDGEQNKGTLCYALVVNDKLAELTEAPGNGRAAHIHEGAAGSNGPVVAALAWPQNGQAGDCISESTEGKFPTKEAGIVQRILKNPQNFYINVHNSAFPAGAIRGQLAETPHVH